MGLIPQSLLRIVGGQRSVVAMVWNRRCHGVEPACGNDRAFPCRNGFEAYLCSVEWHAFSEAGTKKVGRKMRPTCVKVLFRWT